MKPLDYDWLAYRDRCRCETPRSFFIGDRRTIELFSDRRRWVWRTIVQPSDPRPTSLWDPSLRRGALAVAALSFVLIILGVFWLDLPIQRSVEAAPRWLLKTGQWISDGCRFGIWVFVFLAMLLVGVVRGRATLLRWGLFAIVAMASCGILTNVLKIIFGRERPWSETGTFQWFEIGHSLGSFPSGHSTDAGSLFMLAWLISRPLGWACLPIALAFASTRMLTDSHWFSDVVGGFTVGSLGTLAVHAAFVYKDHLRKPRLGEVNGGGAEEGGHG